MTMLAMVSGAILMGYAVAGLFFWRFWRLTRDRLFMIFALSFWVLGVDRLLVAVTAYHAHNYLYVIRLLAYLLILWGIVDKNGRPAARPTA